MTHMTKCQEETIFSPLLQNATGKIPYPLTNDYMFRATFQRNKRALIGLASSILGIKPDAIHYIEILNPIELGKSIEAKDFILDLKVTLNNATTLLIEMQVLNLGNWPERSLGYLCRSYDGLNKGQNYLDAKPVVQVSFLDFTLFKDAPDFFATYMFMNVKNHKIYSDKMTLHVVDLTQIDNANEEDRLRGIDYWARLFKATTWEEVKMLASNNSFLTEAAETVYQLSAEDKIRLQCEAREDFYNQQRYLQQWRNRLEKECSLLEKENASLTQENASLTQENASLTQEKETLTQEKESLTQENKQLLQSNIAKEEALVIKDAELAAKDDLIARLQAELSKYK